MTRKIFSLSLTGLLVLAALISTAQITYVFDTIQTGQYSAFSHSYRLRTISNPSLQKELEAGADRFWITYLSGLHKAMEENDDARAAEILKNMKTELRQQYEQLMGTVKIWKKTHTAAELKKMKAWCGSNPYKTEAFHLETGYNLQNRSGKSKSFHRAYLDLKKSVAMTD